MKKLPGFVWEDGERERAGKQGAPGGESSLAKAGRAPQHPAVGQDAGTGHQHGMGQDRTGWDARPGRQAGMPAQTTPPDPLPLSLPPDLLLLAGASSSAGFGGMPPPRRSFLLLHAPADRGHASPQTLQPVTVLHCRFPNETCPAQVPPPITDTNPKCSRLLLLPSLPLCGLVQGIFTLATSKTDRSKPSHCRVPRHLAPQHQPVYVKRLQHSPSPHPRK